jgi:hypothetical protein
MRHLLLDTLADIIAASVEHNLLAPRELILVRLAALIAVDALPASYLANAGAARESGHCRRHPGHHDPGRPVVRTARVVAVGGNILRALGLAIAMADAELADESDAGQ